MSNATVAGRSSGNMTLLLCVLAAVCEGIDLQAAGVAAAGIVPEFKPTPQLLGSFFSASTLGLFFGALLGGSLSDRLGRKGVLVISIAVFGVCSLLTGLATDMSSLTWARLLTGLGLGGAMPNLIALVSETSADNRRNANVALVYAGTPIGGALISAITLFVSAEHWRWIFIIGGVAPLIVAPIMAVCLQESAAFKQARNSAPIQVDAAASVQRGSFIAVLQQGRALPTVLLWVSFFFGLLTLYLLLNWLPILLTGFGLGKSQAVMAQIGFNVGGAIAAMWLGRMLEGKLRRISVVITFIAVPLLLACLSGLSAQVIMVVLVVFGLGCAVMASQTFLYATAPACYPTMIRGAGVGAAVAMGRIGSITGPKLAGVLVAGGQSTAQLLMYLVPLAAVGGVCAIVLLWLTPNRRPE